MSLEKFRVRYAALSPLDLLRILHNHADYQADAVEAARLELDRRNLDASELEAAEAELEAELSFVPEKSLLEKKAEELKEKAEDSPYFSENPTAERSLMLFLGVIGLGAVWGLLISLFTISSQPYLDSIMFAFDFSFLISHVLTLVLLWFLYKRKKWAWVLFSGLFAVLIMMGLITLYCIFPSTNNSFDPYEGMFLDSKTHYEVTFSTLLYVGCLWLFYSQDFRNLFEATKEEFWTTVGVVLSIVCLFYFII